MRFVDEVQIKVQAGDGGEGAVSFRRERFIPKGGPDGGNGGNGGNVVICATRALNNLQIFRQRNNFVASSGNKGASRKRKGSHGDDLRVDVPVGTIVTDIYTGERLADLASEGAECIVAIGGSGGVGNAAFKSSVRQAPYISTPPGVGQTREVHLELKLLADISLLGLPNAGKSSLLRALTAAKPKVADYPFTTLSPVLGSLLINDIKTIVIADIPGLIEGASEGQGLGLQFLKHLSRTNLTLHIIDPNDSDNPDNHGVPTVNVDKIASDYQKVRTEMQRFDDKLAAMDSWIILSKADLWQDMGMDLDVELAKIQQIFPDQKLVWTSAHNGYGISNLIDMLEHWSNEHTKDIAINEGVSDEIDQDSWFD